MKVSATDMKNNFGKYLEKCKGEVIQITKNDRVVATLSSYVEQLDGFLMLKEGDAAYSFSSSGKRVTYEQFRKMTDNNEERYEYIDGQIYQMTSPGISHQMIHTNLFAFMVSWFKGKRCRVFSAPFDVTLVNNEQNNKNVVEPDLLISCDYSEQCDSNDRYTGIPALVIEILSPSSRSMDQVKKLNVYLDGGVSEYWIVDPRDQQVTLYSFIERKFDAIKLFKAPDIVKSVHFAGLEVPTAEIFAR
jgi:Uma2 family endonuclease